MEINGGGERARERDGGGGGTGKNERPGKIHRALHAPTFHRQCKPAVRAERASERAPCNLHSRANTRGRESDISGAFNSPSKRDVLEMIKKTPGGEEGKGRREYSHTTYPARKFSYRSRRSFQRCFPCVFPPNFLYLRRNKKKKKKMLNFIYGPCGSSVGGFMYGDR